MGGIVAFLKKRIALLLLAFLTCSQQNAAAQLAPHWVVSWAASVQTLYPFGKPDGEPHLSLAFPFPLAGARDQTFRLIVRPDVWGSKVRLRLANTFGTEPITFDGVFVGLQLSGAEVVRASNRAVLFGGKESVRVPPGGSVWSDAVALPFAHAAALEQLEGRKLAVSLHVAGKSGPMTWHPGAFTTSYVTRPGAGAQGAHESEDAFLFSTISWYFLDALDMLMPASTHAVVALGDSITDGMNSTLNGDDRWPDVLARRLHAAYGRRFSVVNAGISGNRVLGPAPYSPRVPYVGGPPASLRLERDVLSLSGVSSVIWLEGINDLFKGANAAAIEAGMRANVARMRARLPGVRIIGCTLPSALDVPASQALQALDEQRKSLNLFIRTSKLFDGVADFDAATLDAASGRMRAEFVPDSTLGGPGDYLHPNRAGFLAMGKAVDLGLFGGR